MKKLLATTALVAFPFGALAADLPKRAPAPAPAPILASSPTWAGFYAGVSTGMAIASIKYQTSSVYDAAGWFVPTSVPALNQLGKMSASSASALGTISVGYNGQFGNVVAGVEVDATKMSFGKAVSGTVEFPCCSPNTMTINQSASSGWLLTLRPRVGVLVSEYLLYGTAGLAFGHVKGNFVYSTTFGETENGSFNRAEFGWTAGVGVERKFASNLSLKAEYLYVSLNDSKIRSSNFTGSALNVFTHKLDIDQHLMRIGLNYRFGGSAAPVVARY